MLLPALLGGCPSCRPNKEDPDVVPVDPEVPVVEDAELTVPKLGAGIVVERSPKPELAGAPKPKGATLPNPKGTDVDEVNKLPKPEPEALGAEGNARCPGMVVAFPNVEVLPTAGLAKSD